MRWTTYLLLMASLVLWGCSEQGGDAAETVPAPSPTPVEVVEAPVDLLLMPVARAREAYAGRVAIAQAVLESDLDAHIRGVAQGGDPVLVRDAMEERDRFLRTGAVPVDPALAEEVERYERDTAQAQVELADVLQAAVEQLTRDLRVDEAMLLREEARRLQYEAAAMLPVRDTETQQAEPLAEVGSNDPELFPGLGTGGDTPPDGPAATAGEGQAQGGGGDEAEAMPEPIRPLDDPGAEALAVAEDAYGDAVELSRQTLLSRIDSRIESLRAAEDIAEADALSAEQAAFREHGALPTNPAMRLAVGRYVTEAGRALRIHARACGQAVADYVAADLSAQADRVQSRLGGLRAKQAFYEAIAEARAGSLPREVYRFPAMGGDIPRLAVSGDGLLCSAWSRDGVMAVWSLATGELVSLFEAPLPDVGWMHMDQGGSIISASSWSHSGMLYRQDGSVIADLDEHRERYNMEVSEDGRYVIIGGHYWTTLQEVEAFADGNAPKLVNDNTSSYSVAINSNAGVAVCGGWDPQVRVYDLATSQLAQTLAIEGKVYGLGFAYNGSHLYAASEQNKLFIWEAESFERVQVITGLPDAPRWSTVCDGGALICANLGRGWVFDTETGRKLYEVGEEGGYHIITPNGAYVLGTDGDQLVLYRLPNHR